MATKRATYLFIVFLFAGFTGMAQIAVPFSMSPIATSSTAITSNGGSAIVLTGKGSCLTVSSGLSIMSIANNGKGVFGASCVEKAPVASVLVELTDINLYPNPTHDISILKCIGVFDANLSCQIRVISLEGKTLFSRMVPMKEVQAGFQINAASYAQGTYVVSIDFMNQHYTKKLIKI